MRILFAGSPAIAVPSLDALAKTEGIEIAGVLTNPDTPKGRHGAPYPTEVGEAAEKIDNLPILKPLKLDAATREQINELKPDLLVSFAYGRIFGPKFLDLFPLGGINVHPSLLPKYRGPSPIQAAILNLDTETGISIQTLAPEMDAGDILAAEKWKLTGRETAESLSETAAQKAAEMLPQVINQIAGGTARKTPQNHGEATYCGLLTKEAGIINWRQTAVEIDAQIRAFNPWPLCRTIHNGRELLILKAAVYEGSCGGEAPGTVLGTDKKNGILIRTGAGILAVTELQYFAKKALFWRDFLNGARDFTGAKLG